MPTTGTMTSMERLNLSKAQITFFTPPWRTMSAANSGDIARFQSNANAISCKISDSAWMSIRSKVFAIRSYSLASSVQRGAVAKLCKADRAAFRTGLSRPCFSRSPVSCPIPPAYTMASRTRKREAEKLRRKTQPSHCTYKSPSYISIQVSTRWATCCRYKYTAACGSKHKELKSCSMPPTNFEASTRLDGSEVHLSKISMKNCANLPTSFFRSARALNCGPREMV
mmetsp:Transcript_178619/g.572580  ORF Transcript_178619/g.572580 Transcript_178619/m.572580 type:complete len:226 (-) Transcript_178619:2881-3558(-)